MGAMLASRTIKDFARALVGHLHGNPLSAASVPEEFLPLLVADGHWRPDGVARGLDFLARVLEVFEEGAEFTPRGGATLECMARTAALLWGVEAYPLPRAQVKAQLRLRQHEDTIAEWPECIGDDRVVRREAARLLGQSGGRPQPPPGSRTSWPWGRGADAGNWPPLGERAELGRRLTGHFGPRHPMVLDDGTSVTFPGLADRVGRPAFDDLRLRLLRTALEPRVAAWFRDAQDTELAIWFRNNIAENWSGHDLFADHLPPLGRRMPSNAKYPAAVATAAQLLAWRISGDREAVADAVRRLVMARSRLVAVLHRADGHGEGRITWHAERLGAPAALSDQEELLLATLTLPQQRVGEVLPRRGWTPGGAFVTGSRSLELANDIRAQSQRSEKLRLIDAYLEARAGAVTGSSRDKVSLALADHSVGWDIVTLGGLDLARRLSQVVLRDQVPARWSLLSHVYRNMGVLLNKRNRWGEALTQVVNGLETLDLLSRGGLVVDQREHAAAAQQLFLAGAGVCVRRLERGLQQARQRGAGHRTFFAQACRATLWFSRRAMSELEFLDQEGQLAATRADAQQRGAISTVAWRAQTRVIRLRAMLAVRTAVDSALCGEGDLLQESEAQGPMVPVVPLAHGAASVAELAEIVSLYRDLQHLRELPPSSAPDVIPLAVWLAFLNGARLPVEDSPGRLFVEHAPLFGRKDHEAGLSDVELRPRLAYVHRWSEHSAQDLRLLSWLPLNGPVAAMLSARSGDLYRTFRSEHANYSKEYSHD